MKEIIKEVFVDLRISLETGFTKDQIERVVSQLDTFRHNEIVPIETLSQNTYLLNETYGPTDAFKYLALQMLTSLVSILVTQENKLSVEKAKNGEKWQKLRFLVNLTSTSGDTGPAWWAGIKWKDFIINVIWFPEDKSTFGQIWQMATLEWNVLALPMQEAFSDIQASMMNGNTSEYKKQLKDIIENELKDLIERYDFEIEVSSGSFNSINPGRIDGQTIYHTYWLLQAKAKGMIENGEKIIIDMILTRLSYPKILEIFIRMAIKKERLFLQKISILRP